MSEDVVGTLLDGRTIVRKTKCQAVTSGPFSVSISIPELEIIDAVLQIQINSTTPPTHAYGIHSKAISENNIVGFTIQELGAGCTICLEVVALGH